MLGAIRQIGEPSSEELSQGWKLNDIDSLIFQYLQKLFLSYQPRPRYWTKIFFSLVHTEFNLAQPMLNSFYRVSRQNCPLFKPKLHHLKWVKFQNQWDFWKIQKKSKRSRGVSISGYYWFFCINWNLKNVVKTDIFPIDWETHPHKSMWMGLPILPSFSRLL